VEPLLGGVGSRQRPALNQAGWDSTAVDGQNAPSSAYRSTAMIRTRSGEATPLTTPNTGTDGSGHTTAARRPEGRPFTVAAFILALLSWAMMPPAGIVGVVCGAIGWSRGDRSWGITSIIASVIGFIGGFVVAGLVLSEWLPANGT
jgi:hypothetical protein